MSTRRQAHIHSQLHGEEIDDGDRNAHLEDRSAHRGNLKAILGLVAAGTDFHENNQSRKQETCGESQKLKLRATNGREELGHIACADLGELLGQGAFGLAVQHHQGQATEHQHISQGNYEWRDT